MPCRSCGGGSVVIKTATTAPLFNLTGHLNVGDRVEVNLRSGYAGFGVVRRVYRASNLEQVDCFMEMSHSMSTVVPAKGDQITLAPAVQDAPA